MAKVIRLKPQTAPQTVAEAVQAFLARDWSPNTRRSFTADLKRFTATFGAQAVGQVTPEALTYYLRGLTTKGRPVSDQTYNRHYGTLTNLFGWLERQAEIERNPMDRVDRRKIGERLPRPLTREQVEALFGHIKDLRDRALFSMLYGSGLRVGEALGLNIEDLNLAEATFRVVGKGDRERVGYLSEETLKLLRRYHRERGQPRSGPVFVSRHGRLSYAMVHALFREYAEGLEENGRPLTIHQLRHTFGSERAGKIDALILKDLMGHKSLRTTQQYAQVSPDKVREAFRAFDRQRQG